MTSTPSGPLLLRVKQQVPPLRSGVVTRERLIEVLRAAETRLTVVVAPAGWGKTTLLSSWAYDATESRRIAWVSLDEGDDEPSRFWRYVLTALHDASDDISRASLDALAADDVSVLDLALPVLLNELVGTTTGHVLVLDDYHTLTDTRIHETVEFLVTYAPEALRVVIAGRADPPLPLARLRARAELTELRADDLRFLPEEAGPLVALVAGHEAADESGDGLWRRTEGWAAGLQLGALALRADPTRRGGDDRHVLEYFSSEVLPHLADAQHDLLVRAAPLELLSGDLCDAALETTGSGAVLAELVNSDLFVTPLDGQQTWFRCHRLLRDALLNEPGADPEGVLERAAAWFASEDRVDDAVYHLLRAGRHDAAAELLLVQSMTWFVSRGLPARLLQLGEQLPASAVDAILAHVLAYAAALCGQRERVVHWLDVSVALRRPGSIVPDWHSMEAAELCTRCEFAVPDGDSALAVDLARRAVELETEDGGGNPTVVLALGSALVRDGQVDEGVDILLDMWHRDRDTWETWLLMQVAGVLSIGLVEAERGAECDEVLRDAAPIAEAIEREGREAATPGFSTLRTVEGRRAYQNRDLEGAVRLLRKAVGLAELHPRPIVLVTGLVYLADAELASGDRAAAREALARAREVCDDEGVGGFARRRLEHTEARMGRGSARAAVSAGALMEELTDRELSILRTLQGDMTQREIGAALFLSVNTVKAYNKSLYRKLGVASRKDAVSVARQLGLI